MSNFANQRFIAITNEDINQIAHQANSGKAFLRPLDWDNIMKYLGVFTGNECKILIYLFKWAGKGGYYFSPADIYIRLDIGEDTARKALNNFKKLGLVEEVVRNKFSFHPMPEKLEEIYKIKLAERALKKKKILSDDEEIIF